MSARDDCHLSPAAARGVTQAVRERRRRAIENGTSVLFLGLVTAGAVTGFGMEPSHPVLLRAMESFGLMFGAAVSGIALLRPAVAHVLRATGCGR